MKLNKVFIIGYTSRLEKKIKYLHLKSFQNWLLLQKRIKPNDPSTAGNIFQMGCPKNIQFRILLNHPKYRS